MSSDKRGFSIIELVIVMTILVILSSIAVLSYAWYIQDSRDSTRISDINQLKIQLRSNKQKTGSYPIPWNSFQIINSGASNLIGYQGSFNENITANSISQFPKDPKTYGHYGYSILKNKQQYQLGTSLEAGWLIRSYVDGDYKSVAIKVLPSLFLAMTGTSSTQVEIQSGVVTNGSDWSQNQKKFVLNGGSYNLLYNMSWVPSANASVDFVGLLTQPGVQLTGNTSYSDCQSIYEAWFAIWPGEYQIVVSDGTVTNTGCKMDGTE